MSEWLAELIQLPSGWVRIVFITIVGYVILTIPLTILTVIKSRRKFSGSQVTHRSDSRFSTVVASLPNLLVLTTKNAAGQLATSVITFKPSHSQENVLYMVSDKQTTRVHNLQDDSAVAVATWFDAKTGLRFSSNQLTAEVLAADEVSDELSRHPEILDLAENAKDQAVMKLTLQSVLIESFRDKPEVITWQ